MGKGTFVVYGALALAAAAVHAQPPAPLVFCAASSPPRLVVVDAERLQQVAEAALPGGARAIAVDRTGAQLFAGYASASGSGAIAIIDAAQVEVVDTLELDGEPAGMAAGADGILYIAIPSSDSLLIVDPEHDEIVATIPIGDHPSTVALSGDQTRAFIGNDYSSNVAVLDLSSRSVVGAIPMPGRPYDIAANPKGPDSYVLTFSFWNLYRLDAQLVPQRAIQEVASDTYSSTPLGRYTYEPNATGGPRVSGGVAVSRDGRFVYFNDGFQIGVIDNAARLTRLMYLGHYGFRDLVESPVDNSLLLATSGGIEEVKSSTLTVSRKLAVSGGCQDLEVALTAGGPRAATPTPAMVPAPSNDDCESAIPLDAIPIHHQSDTRAATTGVLDPPAQCIAGPAHKSVWYSFTPQETGGVRFASEESDYDTVLAAYTGGCSDLVPVDGACSDDDRFDGFHPRVESALEFEAIAGESYRVMVGSFSGEGGILRMSAEVQPTPTPKQTPTPTSRRVPLHAEGEAYPDPAYSGQTVRLDASLSTGKVISSYRWSQLSGPPTQLSASGNSAWGRLVSFVAPLVESATTLRFGLDLRGLGSSPPITEAHNSVEVQILPALTPITTDTPTATITPSSTETGSATPSFVASTTPIETSSPTPSILPSITPTAIASPCVGDCDGDRAVTVDEILVGVTIALDERMLSTCLAFDRDGDDRVTVDEIIGAVTYGALLGCIAF